MQSDYFYAKLVSNAFEFPAECKYLGRSISLRFVYDTGCMYTYVPAVALGKTYNKDKLLEYKKAFISDYRSGKMSIRRIVGIDKGVGVIQSIASMSDDDLLRDRTVCFAMVLCDFNLGGYALGDVDILVSFDTIGSPLLGMNIIQKFTTIQTEYLGAYYLLGVKKNQVNKSNFHSKVRSMAQLEPCGARVARFYREGGV